MCSFFISNFSSTFTRAVFYFSRFKKIFQSIYLLCLTGIFFERIFGFPFILTYLRKQLLKWKLQNEKQKPIKLKIGAFGFPRKLKIFNLVELIFVQLLLRKENLDIKKQGLVELFDVKLQVFPRFVGISAYDNIWQV